MKRYTHTLFPPFKPYTDTSPQALRPLLIGGMVTPVNSGDGGVNLEMVSNPTGLISAVDPWLRMAEGDHVQVYWDTTLMGERAVELADIDERMFFFLPSGPIQPDWAEKVYYRIKRQSTGTDEDSVAMRIRVKLDLPAGVDKDPHLPGHSELAAPGLPQHVIDYGVDEAWAAKGVPVTIKAYSGRAAHDTIELRWGDAVLIHRVTASEAAGDNPIVLTADQATILAGGDSPQLLVHYQVFDEVWNFSTDWSLRTFVNVEAGAQRLAPPIIKEAFNGVLDLEQLGTGDVTVQIEVRGAPFEHDDTVTMTWIGKPRVGNPRETVRQATITNIPSVLEVTVPNAEVRAILEGTATASYVLTKASGEPPQSSKRAFVAVSGKIALPAPAVLEAVGDTLDPLLKLARVVIPAYDAMAAGDVIDLIWLGVRQNGTPYLYEAQHLVTAGEVGTAIHIPVTEEHIGVLANGTLDVSYRVSNDQLAPQDVRRSDHLNLVVAARKAELPKPSVVEAVDDVLDPELVPGHATLLVPYTGTVVNDILTWYWQGESADGSATDWIPITSLIAGEPVTFDIPRSLIEPNINNRVKVLYSLKLASTGKYRYSQVMDLTVAVAVAPTIDNIRDDKNVEIPPGEATYSTTVTISGKADAGKSVEVFDSGVSKGKPIANASGVWSLSVSNLATGVHAIKAKALYGSEPESAVRSFTVAVAVAPTISSIKDSKGDNIPEGGTTYDTTVTITGTAAAGQQVEIFDGNTSKGKVTAAGGAWTITLSSLTVAAHAIKAVAQYGNKPESDVRKFNVADAVKPTISSITDSKGTNIPEGGTTYDTTVTTTGTATAGQKVEVFDGTVSKDKPTADAKGVWTLTINSLATGAHAIKARALYGSEPESAVRRFSVVAVKAVAITSVKDSKGNPISNGGVTTDTTVVVSGTVTIS